MMKLQENRSLGRLGMMGRDGEGWTCAKLAGVSERARRTSQGLSVRDMAWICPE
jgi:hypothetical protein